MLSPKLIPLVDGVRNNKDEWLKLGSGVGGNQQRNSNGNSQSATVLQSPKNGNARSGSAPAARTRKVSRRNSKSSLCDAANCNGNYQSRGSEGEALEKNYNFKNSNINNNACDLQLKCNNCSPEEVRRDAAVPVDQPPQMDEQNEDTMKCTVCRSNSNGLSRTSTAVTSNNNSRLEANNGVNCTRKGSAAGAASGGHKINLDNNNHDINGQLVDGAALSTTGSSQERSSAEAPTTTTTTTTTAGSCGSVNSSTTIEDAVSLINNDSCARTPKIVGKLGNLDSTQLLLSANINHNHHEQETEPGTGTAAEDTSATTTKSVEWKGTAEEQRREGVLLTSDCPESNNNSNNNNNVVVNNDGVVNHLEKSLRRRKSGYCEVAVGAENRRRKSSGRLSGVEDSVSVATGS